MIALKQIHVCGILPTAKSDFDSFFEDTKEDLDAFFSNKVKVGLCSEIKKMIRNGLVDLPTALNKVTNFGVLDKTFTTVKDEIKPTFEVYYFNHESFGGSYSADIPLHYRQKKWQMDDLIAALANFNFHVSASGKLINDNSKTKIKVDKLHFYIKDQFDFADEEGEDSQNLGFWQIISKDEFKIKPKLMFGDEENYFRVQNADFHKYRDDNGIGYDYYAYSTVHTENVNIELDYE